MCVNGYTVIGITVNPPKGRRAKHNFCSKFGYSDLNSTGNYQKAIDCIQVYVFSMFEFVTNVL